jgi:hypothetical protein
LCLIWLLKLLHGCEVFLALDLDTAESLYLVMEFLGAGN